MYEKEERLLQSMKQQVAGRTEQITDDLLDKAIQKGLERAERESIRKQQQLRRRSWTAAFASGLFIILTAMILTSPTIAAKLKEMTGISYFVKLVQGDNTLEKAFEQHYIQPAGISVTRDGIKLTVDGIIVDDQRIILLVAAEHMLTNEKLVIKNPSISSHQEGFQVSMLSYGLGSLLRYETKSEPGVNRDILDFQLSPNSIIPDEIILNSTWYVHGADPSSGTELEISIPIDKERFAQLKEEIPLNQTIDIQGQKITFVKSIISPLRISLEVQYDADNTQKILGFTDLVIVDEDGEIYTQTSGSGLTEDHHFLYFHSNVLKSPTQLTLVGQYVNVMNKAQNKLVLDTEQGIIFEAPDDRIRFESISAKERYTELVLSLNGLDEIEAKTMYSMLSQQFSDGNGILRQMAQLKEPFIGVEIYASDKSRQILYFYLPAESYVQPLTFELRHYPGYIRQPFRLQIK